MRRIPEHLYPAFCLFVLAVKHRTLNCHGEGEMAGGRVFARAAQHVIFLMHEHEEVRQAALEEAGGNLTSTGWSGWSDEWRRRVEEAAQLA